MNHKMTSNTIKDPTGNASDYNDSSRENHYSNPKPLESVSVMLPDDLKKLIKEKQEDEDSR